MQKTKQRSKQQISQGFGERLAALRKAAGYTQRELAAASGVSRRMIVYYENQERQRLADVMVKLAPPLATTADEMVGLVAPKKAVPSVLDARVVRRLRAIEQLASADKRQLLQLIDAFVEHGRRKKRG
jgi:transcriptional regulator with XRE-family HTH domain